MEISMHPGAAPRSKRKWPDYKKESGANPEASEQWGPPLSAEEEMSKARSNSFPRTPPRAAESSEELARHLEERLAIAEGKRRMALEAQRGRAAQRVARVRSVLAAVRQRAEEEAARRQAELSQRLDRAEGWRRERTQARLGGLPGASAEGFLGREAAKRSQLLRQSSSRRLQRCWRDFCQRQRTTRALAAAFLETGVPSSVQLEPPAGVEGLGEGHHSTSTADEETPYGSPDPCASPNSTVRGRGSGSGGATPTNTPEGRTPADTPACGSPVARAGSGAGIAPRTPPQQPEERRERALLAAAKDPFDRFAAALSAPATLRAATALLQRLAAKVSIKGFTAGCCQGLLRRLSPRAPPGQALERYPPRVFLCAYMVLAHPEVVFNGAGEREAALAEAAREMVTAFDALLRLAAAPPAAAADAAASALGGAGSGSAPSVAGVLQRYDEAWVSYLEQFLAWKLADAAGLESELIRMAVELEASKLAKVAPDGSSRAASLRMRSEADVSALVEAVATDQRLISERVGRLTGAQGLARLDAALAAARAAAAAEWTAAVAAAAAAASEASQAAAPAAVANAGEGEAGAGLDVAAALAAHPNLPLAWQLLYDPRWELPVAGLEEAWGDALGETDPMAEPVALAAADYGSEEEARTAVQARVRRIAERAFWDSLAERLAAGAGAGGAAAAEEAARQVASLLADLGCQLAEVLPEDGPTGREIRGRLGVDALLRALLPAAAGGESATGAPLALDSAALVELLEWSARLLREMGAPAREAAAVAAHSAVASQLAAAGGDAGKAAGAAARALRLLAVQLRQLRVDLANARLRALGGRLTGGEGVRYARGLWGEALTGAEELPPAALAARLPHTRAWLAAASGQLQHIEQALPEGVAAAGGQALPALRSGLVAPPGASSSAAPAGERVGLLKAGPTAPRSWQGLVRIGLVSLVTGEAPLSRLSSPELLTLDLPRLHEAQGEAQRLFVLATCLALLRETAGEKAPLAPEAVEGATRRLGALLADPGMRLPDLAAELNALAGGSPGAPQEGLLGEGLRRALARSSTGMKALTAGLSSALHILLLAGDGAGHAAERAAAAASARCGAGALLREVVSLGARLRAVAAVAEAVHQPWLEPLAADLV